MKLDLERYLQELETIVNMDSGQGNPEGITAVGDFFADLIQDTGDLPDLFCHLGGAVIEENENRISLGVNGMRNTRRNKDSVAQVFRSGTLHLHTAINGNNDVGSHVTVLRWLKCLCANQDMVIGFIKLYQFSHCYK